MSSYFDENSDDIYYLVRNFSYNIDTNRTDGEEFSQKSGGPVRPGSPQRSRLQQRHDIQRANDEYRRSQQYTYKFLPKY